MDDPKPSRRRSRAALGPRSLLGIVLVIGLVLGWWTRSARLQRRAVERVTASQGAVVYDFEMQHDHQVGSQQAQNRVDAAEARRSGRKFPTQGPRSEVVTPLPKVHPILDWTRRTLGLDYVHDVAHIQCIGGKLTDADMELIGGLPRLVHLNLAGNPISDVGLAHLGGLKRLNTLVLAATRVTDAGLTTLADLPTLDFLDLTSTAITDAGLARIADLPNLGTLVLTYCRITGAGIEHLRRAPKLFQLNLDGVNLSDAEFLRLGEFKNLKELRIYRTEGGPIPAEVKNALCRALPDLHINNAPSRNETLEAESKAARVAGK